MKYGFIGFPFHPEKRVTSVAEKGWFACTNKRAVVGFAFIYECILECGHKMTFLTEMKPEKGGIPPLHPKEMHCAECAKQND
jgi:hypothetical protein